MVRPERAVGAALVLPYADTEADGLHPPRSAAVAPGAHAVVVLAAPAGTRRRPRRAWDLTRRRFPSSRRVDPVENVWEYLRQNKLSHRVWESYDAIVATCCEAWNWLVAAPTGSPR